MSRNNRDGNQSKIRTPKGFRFGLPKNFVAADAPRLPEGALSSLIFRGDAKCTAIESFGTDAGSGSSDGRGGIFKACAKWTRNMLLGKVVKPARYAIATNNKIVLAAPGGHIELNEHGVFIKGLKIVVESSSVDFFTPQTGPKMIDQALETDSHTHGILATIEKGRANCACGRDCNTDGGSPDNEKVHDGQANRA